MANSSNNFSSSTPFSKKAGSHKPDSNTLSSAACSPEKLSVTLRINWRLLLVGLLLLPVLIRLGFWQLQRADEKLALQAQIHHQQSLPVLQLSDLEKLNVFDDVRYRQIEIQGSFDPNRYWLVDNKVSHGKVGYEVIVPFSDVQGSTLLVNRGWIPAPPLRDNLPEVTIPKGQITLQGRLNQAELNAMIREDKKEESSNVRNKPWPIRIQQLNIDTAESQLGDVVFDLVLQLRADDPNAFAMEWRDINVSVSKHQGYAVQWFSMSVALVIALIFANTNIGKLFSNNNKSEEIIHER